MKSLPSIEQDPYTLERTTNDEAMTKLFAQLFPDTPVPYPYIFDMIKMLETTKVNARILPEVIRGIFNISTAERRGQVIVHVQKGLVNVQIRENSETMSTLGEEE